MTWNDTNYSEIVRKYPVLEFKPESVAIAVWALDQNPEMSPQDWRDLSAQTGVRVAGRAVGSAREIVGLRTGAAKKKRKKSKAKKTSKTKSTTTPKARPANGRRRKAAAGAGGFDDIVQIIRQVEGERDRARDALRRIKDLISDVV